MPPIHPVLASNRLLASLPDGQLRRMLTGCDTVELSVDDVLATPGECIRHVYFPTRSFVSLVMPVDVSGSLEVGLVGDEGMVGIPLALGVDVWPLKAVVQGAGSALRMGADYFCRELERSGALHGGIDRYLYVCLNQLTRRAACTRFHVVEARLARWLLMARIALTPLRSMSRTSVSPSCWACGAPDHQCGLVVETAQADSLPPRQSHRARPTWAKGSVLQLLPRGPAVL